MEELMAEPGVSADRLWSACNDHRMDGRKNSGALNQHKWWDYSDKKWNFDGYICLQYSILWAVLGFVAVRYGDPFFLIVYHMIPSFIRDVLLWILLAGDASGYFCIACSDISYPKRDADCNSME